MNEAAWVVPLLERYTRVINASEEPASAWVQAHNTLQLADTLLDKQRLNQRQPDHALQFVVIGPTQSGKSTLVNVLLDTSAAGISALAGFTVHAQGYATGCSETQLSELEPMMAPLKRTAATSLKAEQLDHYVLENVTAGDDALVSQAVVWDTPDFDSIDAGTYKRAVLNAVAIADVVILMVSKDKYGDKSVWDTLELIQPLAQPLVVCINKLDEQDTLAVQRAFTSRFSTVFGDTQPLLILLPFVPRTDAANGVSMPTDCLTALHLALGQAQSRINRQDTGQRVDKFIAKHRTQWLAPLQQEQLAANEWHSLVQLAMTNGRDNYARDYLNNPDKYDTFNRALAELLTLLEIPNLAPILTRTRELVTWPARKILGVGRSTIAAKLSKNKHSGDNTNTPNQEAETLQQIFDSTLIKLQSELLDQPQNTYWVSLSQALRENQPAIRQAFIQRSDTARADFEPHIEAAAKRLYQQLQSQPALLNSLRAARVTADAAGVALALKSGGLAPADLILAPAMLSVTTLLTESALGRYLDTIKADLKKQQLAHIDERLFQGELTEQLLGLSDKLNYATLFTNNLEPELLDELKR